MKLRLTKKRLFTVLLVALGLLLIAIEAYVLSPALRLLVCRGAESLGLDGILVSQVSDQDPEVRKSSHDALIRRGDRAVPSLKRLLADSDEENRMVAASLLTRMGAPARSAVPDLTRALREDPSSNVRTMAAISLDAICGDDAATIGVMVQLLKKGDEAGKLQAARLLRQHKDQLPLFIEALQEALRDPSPRVRQEAAESFDQIGSPAKQAIPALLAAANDPNDEVLKEVGEALERMLKGLGPTERELREKVEKTLEELKKRRKSR